MHSSHVNHKFHIRHCFNRSASSYDASSEIQQIVGVKLINLLSQYAFKTDNVIDLGCGTGIVTKQLAEQLTFNTFHAIDISDKLLIKATERLSAKKITINEADFDHYTDQNILFDVAFSNMALQWSTDLNNTLSSISRILTDSGIIAFSLPQNKTFSELKLCAKNGFYSQIEITEQLLRAGFEQLSYIYLDLPVQYESTLAALKSIKAVGANYIFNKTSKSLRGKSFLSSLLADVNNTFTITYQIGCYIARKK